MMGTNRRLDFSHTRSAVIMEEQSRKVGSAILLLLRKLAPG
jgi:hypothetical protein